MVRKALRPLVVQSLVLAVLLEGQQVLAVVARILVVQEARTLAVVLPELEELPELVQLLVPQLAQELPPVPLVLDLGPRSLVELEQRRY